MRAGDDCSLSRDHCAVMSGGKCRIIGLYDSFERKIEHINGVKQVSMMADERVALRTANEVWIYDYKRDKTERWQLPCSKISAGYDHLVALSNEGKVHAFGDGSRGQQGSGDLSAAPELTLLSHLEDLTIVDISAGGWHSAALSDRGYLYQWGWNQHGQSAGPEGDTKNVIEVPKFRDAGTKIASVQCGSRHTVVITVDGKVQSWGWDEYGQCSRLKQTCPCVARSKTLRAGFWTTACKVCESCS